jgi:MFS family permease
VFASLSPIIAKKFFAPLSPDVAFVFALLLLSVAYLLRPFGALVFGATGDRVGRKYTFLVTVVVMGAATFLVGLLPTYSAWGVAAPVALMVLRVVQGLSLGGEYGGAVTYVAEHAPTGRRAFFVSWISCTAGAGFVLSVLAILGARTALGEAAFADWGWRIPFLLSSLLLALSIWVRLRLIESPIFLAMKREGHLSPAPLWEAFSDLRNIRRAIAGMLGCIAGSAVVSVMGLLYPLLFLTQTLKVDAPTVNLLVLLSVSAAFPLYPLVGWLADRIGRKPPIVAGCLLAAVTYFPVCKAFTHYANPAYESALLSSPITVAADPAHCSFMFDPSGAARFETSCDVARAALARAGLSYANLPATPGQNAVVAVGGARIAAPEVAGLPTAEAKSKTDAFAHELTLAAQAAGYQAKADPAQVNWAVVWLLMFYLAALAALAFAPVGVVMVELFPARVRFTAMSLPYQLGNGVIAGFLTPAAFALVAVTGSIYSGLWYPVIFAALGGFVTLFFVPETKNARFENWH